jgi:hypothetical protein
MKTPYFIMSKILTHISLWTFISLFFIPHRALSQTTVDRIIVSINNIPYSQLQIERYINVKESLRDDPIKSQTVQESNWSIVLSAFIADMTVHQDASKSSGFRPTVESIQKLRVRSEKAAQTAPQFKTAFDRLGISRNEIESEALKIATIENFRRGKNLSIQTRKINRQIGNKNLNLEQSFAFLTTQKNGLKFVLSHDPTSIFNSNISRYSRRWSPFNSVLKSMGRVGKILDRRELSWNHGKSPKLFIRGRNRYNIWKMGGLVPSHPKPKRSGTVIYFYR